MKRAVLMDRDGVLCVEKHHLHRKEDIELIDGAVDAIRLLNQNDYLVIVITNQPVVARGMVSIDKLKRINDYFSNLFIKQGARIDKIYFCPHHPSEGVIPEYSFVCECRKPKPGMILQAQKEFDLNLEECFMIGDTKNDILAGKNAGCKTIVVKTGYGEFNDQEIRADFVGENLYDAILNIVLRGKK